MVNSKIQIEISSNRMGKIYRVLRFSEFNVELDLETDADIFDFVLENPDGIYSGLFSKFDDIKLKMNGKTIMVGNIDKIEYIDTESNNYIQISGRDLCWKLVDNDAIPDTMKNVQPKSYITNKCKEYGIKCLAAKSEIYDKLVIGCDESEISIMNNLLLNSKQRIWYLVDTLYTGDWAMSKNPNHVFVMHTSTSGIPIETFRLSEDGTDVKSEVRIYGSAKDDGLKLVGSSKNSYMNKIGIKKRQVTRHYSDSASSKYKSIADKNIRDTFRNNTELTIKVRLDEKNVYMPNTTVQVINGRCGVNSTFFVRKVTYIKSVSDGSSATLVLIPADATFEKIWQSKGTSVTSTNKLSKKL